MFFETQCAIRSEVSQLSYKQFQDTETSETYRWRARLQCFVFLLLFEVSILHEFLSYVIHESDVLSRTSRTCYIINIPKIITLYHI